MSKISSYIRKLLPYALLIASLFIYKCPIKAIFGIQCAGCGLTRAMLAALRLDFASAFRYHPLFLIVAAELVYLIFRRLIRRRIKISAQVELAALIITAALFLTVYIIRLKLGILP